MKRRSMRLSLLVMAIAVCLVASNRQWSSVEAAGTMTRLRLPGVASDGDRSPTAPGSADVVSIISVDENLVRVTYNRPMGPSAINPANYAITDQAGQPVEITGVQSSKERSVVELATAKLEYANYTVNINNVSDSSGQQVFFDGRKMTGNPKGAVVSVAATSATRVVVSFNEPMADNAIVPQHYAITTSSGKSLLVTDAKFDGPLGMVVVLTTAAQEATLYSLVVSNVTDLGNDGLGTKTGSFQGIGGPGLIRAVPTDATHITLTFTGALGDSAIAPSSYKVEQLNSAGTAVIETLAVSSAKFLGDQRSIVELTTAPQKAARYQITTNSALTDSAGSPLPVVSLQFDGISGQPGIALVAATGPTTILLTFSVPMSDDVLSPGSYVITQQGDPTKKLEVLRATFIGSERRVVELTTAPQANVNYVISSLTATSLGGTPLVLPATPTINLFTGHGAVTGPSAQDGPPRVVGAASLSNTQVIVAFSEPMGASAIRPEHYVIIQENVNPEAGALGVTGAEFYLDNPSTVLLTTRPQNELTYRVTVVNATDLEGNALAPKVTTNGVLVDPTSATFPGTPPVGGVDTDGDGLSDNAEMRGWTITVQNVDKTTTSRGVTSDPTNPDTDGDGLWDGQEANLRLDPRALDTDDDQLNDYAEFNEIYSNALDQDTDDDTLDDSLEFLFFHTSPLLKDTDGDQMADGDEIVSNRNPLVADLPRPEISVGAVNLQMDVRFVEVTNDQRRDLETKSVTTSLQNSTTLTHSRSDTVAVEAHMDFGYEPGGGGRGAGFVSGGLSAGYTFQQTAQSEANTQQAYSRSLNTDREVTRGSSVERTVQGASMQVTVDLRNLSALAYRVQNLQVTAFIQDPLDHSKLTPVATLLPDAEPADGFTLGPLAAQRGPFIFSNSTIVPGLVESLMANSSGLVFRISNYDIIDERGRNFAFSGQEIIERTSRLTIDFGGASSMRAILKGEAFDEIQPGDETEIHRVATSGGRAIDDTNEDGRIDRFPQELYSPTGVSLGIDFNGDGVVDDDDDEYAPDTVVVFDGKGKEVGIGLHQAMAAIGLVRYEEATTPTASLNDSQILNSYSTIVVGGREKIFRIRGISNDTLNRKFWEILTPLGVDNVTDLNDLILKANTPVSLNFVQDLDGDGLTADVEYFLRTSDSDTPVSNLDPTPRGRDTDKDGLDDRYEALIGWLVTTPIKSYQVWSSPTRKDSNFDDPAVDPFNLYDGSDAFAAPAGWNDLNNNNLRDRFNEVFQTGASDYVLDPIRRDTDGDGIDDWEEVVGFTITRITDGSTIFRGPHPVTGLRPDPLRPDTDGDTFLDGFERSVGLDPTDPNDLDADGDGLPDPIEDAGWPVTTTAVSTTGFVEGAVTTVTRTSNKNSVDSDGDGISDFDEYNLKTNARAADTDADGISDLLELKGFALGHKVGGEDLGIIKTLILDADTDNDKRADGPEAELVDIELARWVVRVSGETPYRVYSNPLIADADFDGVVDGDEFSYDPANPTRRTDPNNGNTDGDRRNDGVEITGGTNPLALDIRVTIVLDSATVSSAGQYNIGLSVRKPDPTGVAGLSSVQTPLYVSNAGSSNVVGKVNVRNVGGYVACVSFFYINSSNQTVQTGDDCFPTAQSREYDPGTFGVPAGATYWPHMQAVAGGSNTATERFVYQSNNTVARYEAGGTTLIGRYFAFQGLDTPIANPQSVPLSGRSLSFGLADGERFSIEGFVTGISVPPAPNQTVLLGGLEGAKANQESSTGTPTQVRTVFSLPQVQDQFLEEFYFEAVVNGATVKLKFYYIIE